MTKYEFELMLNDVMNPISILGIEYEQGTALRKLDSVAFDESYWLYIHDNQLVGEEA